MVLFLLSHFVHEIISGDDGLDCCGDLFDGRLINPRLFALVNTKLNINAVGLDAVLQTKKSNVNDKLLHVRGSSARLQIVDSQKMSFLVIVNRVGSAEAIVGKIKDDFGSHLECDAVIDVSHEILEYSVEVNHVDDIRGNAFLYELKHDIFLVVLIELDAMLDMLASNIMQNGANIRQI
jgi:hypothetical protein